MIPQRRSRIVMNSPRENNNSISSDNNNSSTAIKSEFQEVDILTIPSNPIWRLVPLYKDSVHERMSMWQIGFDGISHLEMRFGKVGGIIRLTRTEVELNQSGKNIQEQALMEARRRYMDKYKEGYLPSGATEPRMIKAMKGEKYEEKFITSWPVATQPKLDGIRMLVQHIGGLSDPNNNKFTVIARSWLNNPYPHMTHILKELDAFVAYLPPYCTLDGELYRHDWDFTLLTSVVKSMKNLHDLLPEVEYHIFDISCESNPPYEVRHKILSDAYHQYEENNGAPRNFFILPCNLANSHGEIMRNWEGYTAHGYEGIMIKKLSGGAVPGSRQYESSRYKSGKGRNILKYKAFKDEEAIILGVVEARGTEEGTALLVVKDERGNVMNIRMRGTFEERKQWLDDPNSIIGKQVTYRYQELSVHGVPRFPVGIAIRDYE